MQVKFDGGVLPSTTPSFPSDSTSATSKLVPSPVPQVPQPVSPLTTICTAHDHLSTLESTAKFPASQLQLTEDVEAKAYDAEAGELEAPTQETATVDAPLVVEGTVLEPSAAVSQDGADIDLAISEEYLPYPPRR